MFTAVPHFASSVRRPLVVLLFAAGLCVTVSSEGAAQRGGRGGGGSAASRAPANAPSPADMIKQQVEASDPFEFLNEHRKQLSLSDAQRDSLKAYQKDMKKSQDPLIKEVYKQMPRNAAGGRGMPDTVRTLVGSLREITQSYEERAFGQLDEKQRAKADTLRIEWMVNQRGRGRP